MADKRLSEATHEFLSATSKVLGKIFNSPSIDGSIIAFGFILATSNMVTFVLFTIFMFLDTVDVFTGKFSHQKVVFDRRSVAVPGFFANTLLFWYGYFSREDHGGIGTLDFAAPFKYKVLFFIGFECVMGIIMLILLMLKKYVWSALEKFWAYLNRWQQ